MHVCVGRLVFTVPLAHMCFIVCCSGLQQHFLKHVCLMNYCSICCTQVALLLQIRVV